MGDNNWSRNMPDFRTHYQKMGKFYGKVEILRPILWYYIGQQNVKVEDLAKRFTDEAIFQLVHDKFITIEELDRDGKIVLNVELDG